MQQQQQQQQQLLLLLLSLVLRYYLQMIPSAVLYYLTRQALGERNPRLAFFLALLLFTLIFWILNHNQATCPKECSKSGTLVKLFFLSNRAGRHEPRR